MLGNKETANSDHHPKNTRIRTLVSFLQIFSGRHSKNKK
jgi:hypothetical protein